MINFLLGFSITLNVVSIIIIIFGYKYIKKNIFIPKIEDVKTSLNNFDKAYKNWLEE